MYIGGIDYAPFVDISSVSATNNVLMNQDNMSFTITLFPGEMPRPKAGQEVIWGVWDVETNTEESREFAGVLTTVSESEEGPALVYKCDCQSYIRWFDRKLVSGFYQQQRAETTIKQIVQRYAPTFNTDHVVAPIVIVAQYFNYQRPSNAVKLICDQIGYGWYIDYYRNLHVYRIEDFPSPLPKNTLDVDNDLVNYGDLVLVEDAEQVYNRFTIRGFKRRSDNTYTLYFTGDGHTTQWNLGYRVSSAKGDVQVKVDGVPYTVKRDILEGIPGRGGEPGVAYIHYTQHLVRFAEPPPPGAKIEVTFYYLVDRTFTDQHDASIEYMRQLEGGEHDGIYEYAEQNKSLSQSTREAIIQSLELLALKHGYPQLRGTFTSFTPGWRAGQSFRMVSKRRMIGDDGIRMWVHRVSKRWIDPRRDGERPIQYTIEVVDTPYLV